MLLTERSFHVIGLTCLGIPDQLSFRSSSVNNSKNTIGSILDLQPRLETERVLFAQQRLTVSIAGAANMMPHKILTHICKGKSLVCFHPPLIENPLIKSAGVDLYSQICLKFKNKHTCSKIQIFTSTNKVQKGRNILTSPFLCKMIVKKLRRHSSAPIFRASKATKSTTLGQTPFACEAKFITVKSISKPLLDYQSHLQALEKHPKQVAHRLLPRHPRSPLCVSPFPQPNYPMGRKWIINYTLPRPAG